MSDLNGSGEIADPEAGGTERDLVELFARHRDRLRRMVQIRLDRRLQGRIDPSDVLQEAQIDVLRRAGEYAADPSMSPYLWLRFLTAQRLMILHRRHLGAQMRAAGQEELVIRRVASARLRLFP